VPCITITQAPNAPCCQPVGIAHIEAILPLSSCDSRSSAPLSARYREPDCPSDSSLDTKR
jgi:hypothetical protein